MCVFVSNDRVVVFVGVVRAVAQNVRSIVAEVEKRCANESFCIASTPENVHGRRNDCLIRHSHGFVPALDHLQNVESSGDSRIVDQDDSSQRVTRVNVERNAVEGVAARVVCHTKVPKSKAAQNADREVGLKRDWDSEAPTIVGFADCDNSLGGTVEGFNASVPYRNHYRVA